MSDAIKKLLGDTLVNNKLEKVSLDVLKDKYIGLLFSASWCPPCRMFKDIAIPCYEGLKKEQKPFEMVFISSDRDETSYNEYLSHMPWLSIPYADRARKDELSQKYKVQGIPTLVLLHPDGKILNRDGRSAMSKDPKGENFPWYPPTFDQILGSSFVDNQGTTTTLDQIKANNDYVLVYFSASWCGPCVKTTPKIVEAYNTLLAKKAQVILVSADQEEDDYKQYFGKMPWLAVPYSDNKRVETLNEYFMVEGIPSLNVVDLKTGKVITKAGVESLMQDPKCLEFPWIPKPLKILNGAATDYFNTHACFMVLCDKKTTTTVSDGAHAAIQNLANKYSTQFKSNKSDDDGDDEPLVFMFGDHKEQGLIDKVRDFLKLGEDVPRVVVMNIPKGQKYISTDISEQGMASTIDAFLAGKLTMVPLKQ